MTEDASSEELTNIQQLDQLDLCQGYSSNRHVQWKSIDFQLNRHIVLRPLGSGVLYQTCGLQGIPRIWSLWKILTLDFSGQGSIIHYNHWERQVSKNQ